MSRQYNDYMCDRFEIFGEEYEIIEPKNFEELLRALEVKEILQNYLSGLLNDENPGEFPNILQEQDVLITTYLRNLGEFDNSILISNINYLAKKNNLRIGDVEKMLGISTGYISRTAKENSSKKLSIDVVWKIAKLFEVNIKNLLEQNLSMPSDASDILIRFMGKLYRDTKAGLLDWENRGGVMCEIEQCYLDLKLITEDGVEEDTGYTYYRYHPNHMNPECKWMLLNDIVSCSNFDGEKALAIIPFGLSEKEDFVRYDFIFIWKKSGKWTWEKIFYTSDDAFGQLNEYAASLYEMLHGLEFNAKISLEIRTMIEKYLKD